jgi:ribosome biogenesis protein BMS1
MQNEKYMKNDIQNLARFISVLRFRPLTWKNNHPYLLADRVEDLTHPSLVQENAKINRKTCFYGYLRGANLRKNSRFHLPGIGDYKVSDISILPDPCPLPTKVRKLDDKQKLIYAPMSDLGGILYDQDAVYINVPEQKEENELVERLKNNSKLDDSLEKSGLKLFSGHEEILTKDDIDGRERRKVEFKTDLGDLS